MPITEYTVFETTDGLRWDDRQKAEHHQAGIDLAQFFRDGLGGHANTHTADIIDLVWRHREIVKGILARAEPPDDIPF